MDLPKTTKMKKSENQSSELAHSAIKQGDFRPNKKK